MKRLLIILGLTLFFIDSAYCQTYICNGQAGLQTVEKYGNIIFLNEGNDSGINCYIYEAKLSSDANGNITHLYHTHYKDGKIKKVAIISITDQSSISPLGSDTFIDITLEGKDYIILAKKDNSN